MNEYNIEVPLFEHIIKYPVGIHRYEKINKPNGTKLFIWT